MGGGAADLISMHGDGQEFVYQDSLGFHFSESFHIAIAICGISEGYNTHQHISTRSKYLGSSKYLEGV